MSGRVTSADGTAIAYDRAGAGPAVILVGGGAVDRSENAPLAAALAARFTVFNYDRRGRGASGDAPPDAAEREIDGERRGASGDALPHTVRREVEDIAALVAAAGGSAHVYGVSSGGALALAAAAAGVAIDRLAVYEIPYRVDESWPPRWRAYVDELGALLAAGRRGDAFARFMRLAETPEDAIAAARDAPFWPDLELLAPTLAYDAACLGDGRPPADLLARVVQPTLVATGVAAREPGAAQWVKALDAAADAVAASLPHGERAIVDGQGHVPDPQALEPMLTRFFAAG
ncbi:MAG TPA: alpha/beta fold hydrolase [Solirubrobacteraceae bacterium]|nr:alpha/beta fold hydrolase [Solirubrobacteraceae bacterium]